MSPLASLHGKRILIVERTGVLQPNVTRRLEGYGVQILGPVASLEEATLLLETEEADAAIIDLNIPASAAALFDDLFEEHHVPYLFAQSCASLGSGTGFHLIDDEEQLTFLAMTLFPETIH